MKHLIKNVVLLSILFFSVLISGQNMENIFFDRGYWKTNPSIADINQKIEEGHDIAALNEHSFDAVSWALIEKVDNETVKYLLTKKGNNVNKLTHDGRTYIFWAAYRDNLAMMQYLVDQGAKTDIIDRHGYSLLNFSAVTGQLNPKLYDFCIAHGAKIAEEKNHDGANALLLVSSFIKDHHFVSYFTSKGIDLHSTDTYGNGIFSYAAKKGNMSFMNWLIDQGVAYKKSNNKGGNAMIFASKGTRRTSNSLDFFQYLEKLGITPYTITKDGTTPLHALAYKSKDLKVLEYFISKGIDVNKQDKDGKSALVYSIANKNNDVLKFLLQQGADLSVKDTKGNNLGYYLFKSYSSKKQENFDQKLALLIENGFDFKKPQDNGDTLYHLAVDKHDILLLEKISKLEIDINAKNKKGLAPIHKAAMQAKDDTVLKYLLSHGADKKTQTGFDESVFDLAKENELLLKNNVELSFLK